MIRWILTAFCLLFVLNGHNGSISAKSTPRYSVNLDPNEGAMNRWKQVGEDYHDILKSLKERIMKHYHIPTELVTIADKIGADLKSYIPSPFSDELIGLAAHSGIPLPELVLANLVYELTAFCTSIVAVNNTGSIIHGRNLDYELADDLKELVIDVDFKRNGNTVYTGTTFAGYIGLLTAQKPNTVTVTLNQRNEGNPLENILELLLNGSTLAGLAIRELLDSPDVSFLTAVHHLAYEAKFISPCYLVLGGVNGSEGVVITRGRLTEVGLQVLDPANGRWFVLQTNYDSWTTPPPSDNRRDPAIKMMNKLGRAIALDTLYSVLNRKPVCNSKTTYTTTMSAAAPSAYYTHIREDDCI